MRIFIASSGERLNMAIEVGSWLEGMNVEPVLWNEPEVFPLGAYTWDALIDLSENVDAAIFIFGENFQKLIRFFCATVDQNLRVILRESHGEI